MSHKKINLLLIECSYPFPFIQQWFEFLKLNLYRFLNTKDINPLYDILKVVFNFHMEPKIYNLFLIDLFFLNASLAFKLRR